MPWNYISDVDAFTIYHRVREENLLNGANDSSSLPAALGHALAGSCGTAVSNVIVYPLDLVITRLQVQQRTKKSLQSAANEEKSKETLHGKGEDAKGYQSIRDAGQKIYRNEGGVSAFYAGISQDTAKSMIDSFLFFLAYNMLWHLNRNGVRRSSSTSSSSSTISSTATRIGTEITMGVIAGATTKAITSPIQQIVTRKQTSSAADNSTSWEIACEIHKSRGIRGFWAGYTASLVLTLNPSLTFFVDSLLRRAMTRGESTRDVGSSATFLVAALGKVVASSLMYPVSLAKTRVQASSGAMGGPGGVLATIPHIARMEGVGALYAGLAGEVLKGFFSHGLTMLVKARVHELVLKLWWVLAGALSRAKKMKA